MAQTSSKTTPSVTQHNEKLKFVANAFDRASTACITSGILTPLLAFLYGSDWNLVGLAFVAAGAIFCMGLAFFLHFQGRKYLLELI